MKPSGRCVTSEVAWFDAILQLNRARTVPILFVVYARQDKWGCQAVSTIEEPFKPLWPFPESWRGLSDEALQRVSGLSDAVFCHKAGHLLVANSKEGALRAAGFAKPKQAA